MKTTNLATECFAETTSADWQVAASIPPHQELLCAPRRDVGGAATELSGRKGFEVSSFGDSLSASARRLAGRRKARVADVT